MNSSTSLFFPKSRLSLAITMWHKQYAIPQEKGAWIWWIAPLLLGITAAQRISIDLVPLVIAALFGFLLRQPLTLLVKIVAGRRSRRHLAPACIWLGLYSSLLLICTGWLVYYGHTWVLGLSALLAPIIARHTWLVAHCKERHQPALDIAAAVVAASTAPAAYWTCQGPASIVPWTLWLITGIQASASIVHMFVRLRQRLLNQFPPMTIRWKMGAWPLAHHTGNFLISLWLWAVHMASAWVVIAFGITWVEGILAVIHPQINSSPRALGMRQLTISLAFFLVLMIGYL